MSSIWANQLTILATQHILGEKNNCGKNWRKKQRYRELPDVGDLRDPKTHLQEWLQGRKMELPIYKLADVSGEDHKRRFSVTCTVVEESMVTDGESTTRRKAEQKAARKMIEMLIGEQQ